MEIIVVGIGVLLLVGFIGFLYWKKSVKAEKNAWKKPAFGRAMNIINTTDPVLTPNGHKVYFEAGTNPTGFSLQAVDAGVKKSFEKAECAGYNVNRSQHKITVVSFMSEPDSQGDPAYRLSIGPMNPYWGSEWDKATCPGEECDHWVLAAAQMAAAGEPYGDVIIVPHHTDKEAHLATVVEYEMEHILLAWYDGVKYEETKTHLNGQGHPLLADCPGTTPVGFASTETSDFFCGGAQK